MCKYGFQYRYYDSDVDKHLEEHISLWRKALEYIARKFWEWDQTDNFNTWR